MSGGLRPTNPQESSLWRNRFEVAKCVIWISSWVGALRPGDARLSPRPESDGAPRSQSFSLEPEVLMGLPSAQGECQGPAQLP